MRGRHLVVDWLSGRLNMTEFLSILTSFGLVYDAIDETSDVLAAFEADRGSITDERQAAELLHRIGNTCLRRGRLELAEAARNKLR